MALIGFEAARRATEFDTVLGTVSILRSLRPDAMSPFETPEEPRISIAFGETPVTIGEAWRRVRRVRHFFAWMMGYARHDGGM